MRRTALITTALAAALTVGLLAPGAAAGGASSGGAAAAPALPAAVDLSRDSDGDCDMLVPAQQTLAQLPAGRTTPEVRLDVLVLLEKRHLAQVRADVAKAATSYSPLGIALVPRFRVVGPVPDLAGSGVAYLEWAKKVVGGKRPAGSDVVYLATDRYIDSTGRADCIGGVAHPEHAFAVGQLTVSGLVGVKVEGIPTPIPDPPVKDGGVLLVVHEIGHLLGAHHHYGAACVGVRSAADPSRPCDVMLSLVKQQTGLQFGPVNAAVVRDHAERFARP